MRENRLKQCVESMFKKKQNRSKIESKKYNILIISDIRLFLI